MFTHVSFFLFTEGGRLEEELKYTAEALGEVESSTHQLIIQTAKDPDASILHAGALLEHLKVFFIIIVIICRKTLLVRPEVSIVITKSSRSLGSVC